MDEKVETDEVTAAVTLFTENGVDKVLERLVEVQTKLVLSIEELPRSIVDPTYDKDIHKIRNGFHEVSKEIHSLFRPLITAKKVDAERIMKLETSFGELCLKWQNEQKKVAKLESEINRLKDVAMQQSTFSSNLGAVFGSLLWRCSKIPQIVQKWLDEDQDKVGEFLSIAGTTTVSFIEAFSTMFPNLYSDECQFVMAILGTVTNISSSPVGRQYLITHSHGKDLVVQIIKAIPEIPKPSGDGMRKLMLHILYNVSLNNDGLPFLMDLKVDEIVSSCFDEKSTDLIQNSVLRLVQSITFKLNDLNIFHRLIKTLPIDKIQSLARSLSDELNSKIAQEIMANLKNCCDDSDTLSHVSSSIDKY